MSEHDVTVDDHGPDGFGTRFQAYCSCGWDGARQWPEDVDQPGFDPHGLSAQEANEAAERDGAEHLAESAPR